jgi:ribosomal protein L11 methyltransferase
MKPPPSVGQTFVARVHADRATAERIADCLAEQPGPAGMAIGLFEGPHDRWTVEISLGGLGKNAVRQRIARAAGNAAAKQLRFEPLPDRDWIRSSLAGLQPVEAGRFVVHGSHDRHRIGPNRIGIEIEAALAFGTGHHGTTRGCLLALDRIIKSRRPRRVLDVGTGTGVLAIAAAKASRARVLASDIDPIAVRTASANTRANGAGDRVEVIQANGVTARSLRCRGPFDLVFANILLTPLQGMARSLSQLVVPNGHVMLSGLLPNQANAALSAYAAHGLRLEHRICLDGWLTLVLKRL